MNGAPEGADKKTGRKQRMANGRFRGKAEGWLLDQRQLKTTPSRLYIWFCTLFYLIENRNIALSRDKLLSDIWGYDFFGDDRTIDTHIKNLRNAIGPYRDYIVTLRGVGYKFEYED